MMINILGIFYHLIFISMMNNFNSFGGFSFGHHVHMVFGLFFFVGLILFTIWAVQNLKGGDLKKWVVWLLVIGVLGWLLTAPMGGFGFGGYGKGGWSCSMMKSWGNNNMWQCLQDDACEQEMESVAERMMGPGRQ